MIAKSRIIIEKKLLFGFPRGRSLALYSNFLFDQFFNMSQSYSTTSDDDSENDLTVKRKPPNWHSNTRHVKSEIHVVGNSKSYVKSSSLNHEHNRYDSIKSSGSSLKRTHSMSENDFPISSSLSKYDSNKSSDSSHKRTHSMSENVFPISSSHSKSKYDSTKSSDSSHKRSHSMSENVFPISSSHSKSKYDSRKSSDSSLKRAYSMAENDFPISSTLSHSKSKTFARARRSLPSEVQVFKSPVTQVLRNNRKSWSSYRTPSPHASDKRPCTDQTPYTPPSASRAPKRLKTALPYYNASELVTFKSDMGFIDSHCHLDFLFQRQNYRDSYSAYQKKHKDTFPECYKGCVAIFCNPHSFDKKYLWESYLEEENVWASFGCHPHNAKDYNDDVEKSLISALKHPKVRALGEIGLDYSNRNDCLQEVQHDVFRRQLRIALRKKLPLVIHMRDAHDDGMTIMKEMVPKDYFIHLHCFTDSWEMASAWMQEFPNLFIGITNVVTFPSAECVHEVAKNIPLNRLLLETDAPYFIPRPLQREFPQIRHSHPGMAIHVAAQIAALKEVSLELVLHCTRRNTDRLYNL